MGEDGAHPALGSGALSEKRARTVDGILAAAMLIVTEEGVAALSMSTLAARAGLSRQTLYNYFPDVEAVLTGMARMGEAGAIDLAGSMQAEPEVRVALRSFVRAAVESVRMGHPSPVAITAALPVKLQKAMAAHEELAERTVIDLLRRGMRDGVFSADLDPILDGQIVYRAAFAAAELARRADVDADLLAQRLETALLRSLTGGDLASPRS